MLRFTDSLHWGSKGASGIWLNSPLEVKDTSSIEIYVEIQQSGDYRTQSQLTWKAVAEKILYRGCEKNKGFCLWSMPECVVLATTWIRVWEFKSLQDWLAARGQVILDVLLFINSSLIIWGLIPNLIIDLRLNNHHCTENKQKFNASTVMYYRLHY